MAEAVVFDAYGTLFDVAAPARRLAAEPGRERLAAVWPKLARDWRLKQLQYTWLRVAMGVHADFWTVTEDALDWALEAAGLAEPELRAGLLDLYRRLEAYPEAAGVIEALRAAGRRVAILSNGTPAMLAEAVESAGIGGGLDAVLSVEAVGVFKPARAVYDLVGREFGLEPERVLFVSANGWDAAAGATYGFRTAWVNRGGEPLDRLPGSPDHVIADLRAVPDLAR